MKTKLHLLITISCIVFFSLNVSAGWIDLNAPSSDTELYEYQRITTNSNGKTIVACANRLFNNARIYSVSDDYGVTWKEFVLPLSYPEPNDMFFQGDVLYLLFDKVYKTTDYTTNFTLESVNADFMLGSLLRLSENNWLTTNYNLDTNKFHFYKSADQGKSWTDNGEIPTGSGVPIFRTYLQVNDSVIITNNASSIDGGKTWIEYRATTFTNDYHVYLSKPENKNVVRVYDYGTMAMYKGSVLFLGSWTKDIMFQFSGKPISSFLMGTAYYKDDLIITTKLGDSWISKDEGLSYESLGQLVPGNTQSILRNCEGKVYFAGLNKIYRYDEEVSGVAKKNKLQLNIYPNPAYNHLTIDNLPNNALISITDITGREVWSTISTNTSVSLNTTDFNSGIYFVKVEHQNTKDIQKILIKK